MKHISSPRSSRTIFLLVSQNMCNGSNPCCSLQVVGHCGCGAACTALLCRWKLVLPYRGVLSLGSLFQLSQTGWESPDSHQGTLDSHGLTGARGGGSQGRPAVGSSLAKARSLFFVMCAIAHISLQTLHCVHAVPPVQSRQNPGILCRPAHGTALVCGVTVGSAHPGADRGSEMLRTSVLTLGWGSNSSAPDAARDEKQSFPLPNFLILALHLEALHCWLPW